MAIGFGRADADAEFIGDHLGQLAFKDALKNFFLARRQLGNTFANFAVPALQFGALLVDAQALLDAFDQRLRREGFLEEIKCATAHGADNQMNFGVSGNENGRQDDAARVQFVL